ncbi:MAG: hypothetical protein K6C10_08730 [Prevotella sp.]|nr:hypothetical protein [Prevotella sp.]
MKNFLTFVTIAFSVLFSACTSTPENVTKVDQLPPIFPDYIDVTIPVGIAPLNFNVLSSENLQTRSDGQVETHEGKALLMGEVDCVDVVVRGSKGGELHANGSWAAFDEDNWHELVSANRGGKLTLTVCAKINGKWIGFNDFDIHVSNYALDEWGLTYRRIAPGYEVYSRMGIYQRDLSTFDESPIIDNSEIYGMCVNCHTSNRTNPSQFVYHVRGEHGATVIKQADQLELLKATNETLGGSMVYPYWHPSGQYCAFSTNQTRQGFHVAHQNRIEVFDASSDVFVYSPSTHEIISDSLLSTKDWSENCPVFSPDGRKLYFITCLQQAYPMHYKDEQYNLCCIDFDPEDGTFGQKVDTLFNAVAKGKSLTWPKPSYDGRFLMFTLLDYGYFSIWHRESDQWLLNLETGEARPVDEINSNEADSYHNWNVNSRWIVFTSRRANGLYSQLFLASIDENGRATKPFLLPQENPLKYYDETLYSFNTPDFASQPLDLDQHEMRNLIESNERVPVNAR